MDRDGRGDACDGSDGRDDDGDGVANVDDNCPANPNPGQEDVDRDGRGDACDGSDDRDDDGDGVPNIDDNCPANPNPGQEDADRDGPRRRLRTAATTETTTATGVVNVDDNCPANPNPGQEDVDRDGRGDACDGSDDRDDDGDGVANVDDNCPANPNPGQEDTDRDGRGDACDDPEPVNEALPFSVDFRLTLTNASSGFSAGETDSFGTEIRPGGGSFSDFEDLVTIDPASPNLQAYLEIAVGGTERLEDDSLLVTLRSLSFIEGVDGDGRSTGRLSGNVQTSVQVTLRPGQARELRPGAVDGGSLQALLAPSVSAAGAEWRGSIVLTLRYGR